MGDHFGTKKYGNKDNHFGTEGVICGLDGEREICDNLGVLEVNSIRRV